MPFPISPVPNPIFGEIYDMIHRMEQAIIDVDIHAAAATSSSAAGAAFRASSSALTGLFSGRAAWEADASWAAAPAPAPAVSLTWRAALQPEAGDPTPAAGAAASELQQHALSRSHAPCALAPNPQTAEAAAGACTAGGAKPARQPAIARPQHKGTALWQHLDGIQAKIDHLEQQLLQVTQEEVSGLGGSSGQQLARRQMLERRLTAEIERMEQGLRQVREAMQPGGAEDSQEGPSY